MSKNVKHMDEILTQLVGFSKSWEDLRSEYAFYEIHKDHLLVRLFSYTPQVSEFEAQLFFRSKFTGEIEQRKESYDWETLPVGMVISAGPTEEHHYRPGDLVVFAAKDVVGTQLSREYIQFMEAKHTKGMNAIWDDDTMEKYSRAAEKNWVSYLFTHPYNVKSTKEDKLTFQIPYQKVKARWEFLAYLETLKKED